MLVVLAAACRRRLEKRRHALFALCGQDHELLHAPEARIDVCFLEDLQTDGPFAPILRSADESDRAVDWLGAI